jgi:hypothetical protein
MRIINEGDKWNHNDVCHNGVCSSYTVNGKKIKFFVKNGNWVSDKLGEIPQKYVDGFDMGDQKIMNKYAKEVAKKLGWD